MKGVESSMKLVALGATQLKGKAGMVEEWIRVSRGMNKDVIVVTASPASDCLRDISGWK